MRYPWWPVLFMSGSLLWAMAAVLMVVAFVRRRRVVAAQRANQRRLELHYPDSPASDPLDDPDPVPGSR
jgi:hypothetical protein